jgi:hypothetical protein
MTKGKVTLPFRFDATDDVQQVPPLRFASVGMTLLLGNGQRTSFALVGMTKGKVALPLRFDATDHVQQVPPLRYPGFPVDLGGVGALHAPFRYRKAHTRTCPVQRGRKSGYAPVGMTKVGRNR